MRRAQTCKILSLQTLEALSQFQELMLHYLMLILQQVKLTSKAHVDYEVPDDDGEECTYDVSLKYTQGTNNFTDIICYNHR